MGKTADLTVVQKTIIDTLHKEGKTQTFITKEAVSKHVNRKMSGRKKCGRKRCTTNRENRSLMRIVKKNRFKNLGELHKEWTEAGVKASRAPHTDVSRNLATVVIRGVLPGLRRRRTGLLPSGPKSSFQMRASFVLHLETKKKIRLQHNRQVPSSLLVIGASALHRWRDVPGTLIRGHFRKFILTFLISVYRFTTDYTSYSSIVRSSEKCINL